MRRQPGVTLIELLVVLVIVGILAAVAIPGYRDSVRKSHRRAAQAAMLDIANREEQYFVAQREYAADPTELGYTLPPEVGARYDVDISLDAGPPPGFTIDFTAKGQQLADGDLALTSEGVKSPAEKWQ